MVPPLIFLVTRSGKFETVGASNIYVVDLDLDVDNDLVFNMEVGSAVSDFSGEATNRASKGIQIWENNGNLQFFNATDDWLSSSIWLNNEMGGPSLEVEDLNGDSYPDIFINRSVNAFFEDYDEFNIGSAIFLNQAGESFRHLADVSELTVAVDGGPQTVTNLRLAQINEDHFDLMIVNNDQTFGMVEILHSDLNAWIV
jgi:hypothetical protein